MAKKKMYVVDPVNNNSPFINSAWCGEGYATKKDAVEHVKMFKKMWPGEDFEINTEDAPEGW